MWLCLLVTLIALPYAVLAALTEADFNKYRDLWSDKHFVGSYSGANTFHKALQNDGYNISYPDVTKILHSIPDYVNRIRRQKIPNYRPYRVDGYNLLWECDNAIMPLTKGAKGARFLGFLLVIDVFSRKIWTRPWKTHNITNLSSKFLDIFEENLNQKPEKLQQRCQSKTRK